MMTREEAIKVLNNFPIDFRNSGGFEAMEALKIAILALRPVSREQVEKVWRGCSDCVRKTCVACKHFGWAPRHCIDCNNQSKWAPWNFCPVCGKPLTDEAVQMVMERINKMEETGNGLG